MLLEKECQALHVIVENLKAARDVLVTSSESYVVGEDEMMSAIAKW